MKHTRKVVYSETASFREIVEVLYRGARGESDAVDFAEAWDGKRSYSSESVYIGKTPEYLISLGLPDRVIISRKYLERAIKESVASEKEDCNYSKEQKSFENLMDVLAYPGIILRRNDGYKDELTFMCCNGKKEESDDSVFKNAVVKTNSYYDGLMEYGPALEVLSFCVMNANAMEECMCEIVRAAPIIEYWSADDFGTCKETDMMLTALGLKEKDRFIVDSLSDMANISEVRQLLSERYHERLRVLIESELRDFLRNVYDDSFRFWPVIYAAKVLNSKTFSFKELMASIQILIRAAVICDNKALINETVVKAHDMAVQNIIQRPCFALECEVNDYFDMVMKSVQKEIDDMEKCNTLHDLYAAGDRAILKIEDYIPLFGFNLTVGSKFDEILMALRRRTEGVIFEAERKREFEIVNLMK